PGASGGVLGAGGYGDGSAMVAPADAVALGPGDVLSVATDSAQRRDCPGVVSSGDLSQLVGRPRPA
ncbi:MAG: hypothetical protein ACR2G2_09580, partial [Pseudonocardia sp.]